MTGSSEPGVEEYGRWHRRFGVDCNNRAWRLSERADRSREEDGEMVQAAFAAAYHWGKVGTELQQARAAMVLGHVLALIGQGGPAVMYATQAFDYITSHESDAWEIAFAHAVQANAAFAAGDLAGHARHYAVAAETGAGLESAEDREIFEATFARIPVPAGAAK